MPELRHDPITGRRVLISTEREGRPQQFVAPAVAALPLDCPFCWGHEQQTPPAVLELRDPATDRWRVRVIPNKFPALEYLTTEEQADWRGITHESTPALGSHEVIIESPDHRSSITSLSVEHYADVLAAYQQRIAYWKAQTTFAANFALPFKNSGPAAGASLEHLHSQLTVLPFVPPLVEEELRGAERHFAEHDACIYCQLIDRELAAETRIVEESEDFVAFCPFASRFPLETWIVPKRHASHFEETPASHHVELARLLRNWVMRLETLSEGFAYNYFLHSAPLDRLELNDYHWHIEIAPRLATLAGFELGGGIHINPLAPETAAARLREMKI